MIGNIGYERRLQALERRMRDISYGVPGIWDTWTPSITQGVALGASALSGEYVVIGKLVIVGYSITLNSAGTAGQPVVIGSLPKTFAAGAGYCAGYGTVLDSGTRWIDVILLTSTGDTFKMQENNTGDVVGVASAYTAASGDLLTGTLMYQST